jgi:hypothetical protein
MPANIRHGGKRLAVANALAYHYSVLITGVKSFMVQAPLDGKILIFHFRKTDFNQSWSILSRVWIKCTRSIPKFAVKPFFVDKICRIDYGVSLLRGIN